MSRRIAASEVNRFLTAWFEVRQLIQAANFNHFQRAGLSATQFMTLNVLPNDETGISIGDLARRMNLKPATVAKTVDSLEARAMLARTRSAADGRLVLVAITPAGRQLQNAAAGQFRAHMEGLFRTMDGTERAGLIAGLESLVRVSRTADPEPRERTTPAAGGAAPAVHSSPRSRRP